MDKNLPPTPSPNLLRRFAIKQLGDLVYEQAQDAEAEVCVIVPLYNYEQYIAECLNSVVAQDLERLSITVVDDCSSDLGGAKAIQILSANKNRFCASRVIRHRENQGLAMARNAGLLWSREAFLFMLDADNRIRPPALSRLRQALMNADAAVAYAQIFRFGDKSGIGIADVWDPERFQNGNYVDGMALIRRSALLAAGGYRVSAIEEGWEDFDLWCRFAQLGHRGVYLPEILCEYRVHRSSMLSTRTERQERSLKLEMMLRHPELFDADDLPPLVNPSVVDSH